MLTFVLGYALVLMTGTSISLWFEVRMLRRQLERERVESDRSYVRAKDALFRLGEQVRASNARMRQSMQHQTDYEANGEGPAPPSSEDQRR